MAQISYGGTPLFLDNQTPKNSVLRTSGSSKVLEMPAFNIDSVKQSDEALKQNGLRGGYRFAHKFYTHIKKGKDGKLTVLSDGTKVWQVEIRSAGAYSLNLLFTNYHIPEGGKLFLYNADHSHVIGAFDHRNNSVDNILPTRPVGGEAIIVEYSEPANVAFEGELEIGEVNHDYRDILRREPAIDQTARWRGSCMQDVLCSNAEESTIRSTVLLTINGNTGCTASLINNTANDGTPYLLTAVHCLNDSIGLGVTHDENFYVNRAATIIAFFNYNNPVCRDSMRATEEQSLAIAYPRVILENKDIALLELQSRPPLYYNAYYAGWNVNSTPGQSPYTNIHHPLVAVKKFGEYDGVLSKYSAKESPLFDANAHWKVASWNIGSTAFGSSGSPLFDNRHLIVGGLTGGSSFCNDTSPNGASDYFFALYQGWENTNNANNQLKTYLDPENTDVLQYAGLDPNKDYIVQRTGNANYNGGDLLTKTTYSAPNSGLLFGKSNFAITEFAEEFQNDLNGNLEGVFVYLPKMSYATGVEIRIYEGENEPETLIGTQNFRPQYLNYSTAKEFVDVDKTTNVINGTENFVRFNALPVNKKFYVAYSVAGTSSNDFAVYNTLFDSSSATNTAWLKTEQGWTKANEYAANPMTTSLAIQPLLHFTNDTVHISDEDDKKNAIFIYLRDENKLILPTVATEAGIIRIYNTTGQLLQQMQVAQGKASMVLQPQAKNSIGIVRLVRGNHVYTGKIIY